MRKSVKCGHCRGTGTCLDHEAIGLRMKAKRLKANLKLSSVAATMGVSISHLSYLERGLRRWNCDLEAAYEKALK